MDFLISKHTFLFVEGSFFYLSEDAKKPKDEIEQKGPGPPKSVEEDEDSDSNLSSSQEVFEVPCMEGIFF